MHIMKSQKDVSVIVTHIHAFDFEGLAIPASSELYVRRTVP